MAGTRFWAIGLMLLVTLLATAGNLFYKEGIMNLPSVYGMIFVAAGLLTYALNAVLLILALRGGELTVLYPIMALSYIWVSIVSPIFFATDSMNPLKWVGVGCIFLGVSAVGWGR